MRNLKRALSLTLASVMLLGMMVIGTSAASYPDVTDEHNVEAIEVLQAVGAMSGSNSGNFNPDSLVSRVEMAIVMANLLGLDVNYFSGQNHFTDVPSWAGNYVAACEASGIISGVGGNNFGTGDVTATQAALMMLKALGYFQYAEDFGTDWARATAQQAAQIRLFEGLDVANNTRLTRNQVAQLALNALQATMVDADDNTLHITTPDGTTAIGGKVNYVVRASTQTFANAISNAEANAGSVSGTSGWTIELGEQLYNGKLKKNSSIDDFGRPATTWKYLNDDIGTYADAATATFVGKVSRDGMYNTIGRTVLNGLDGTQTVNTTSGFAADNNSNTPKMIVYYDGVAQGAQDYDYYAKRNDNTASGMSGNGVVTEVYVDKHYNVIVSQYATYLMQATNDYSSSRETLSVTMLTRPAGAANVNVLDLKDFGGIADMQDDDYILYTYADGEVQSVSKANVVTGKVDSYSNKTGASFGSAGGWVRLDGQQYNYAKFAETDSTNGCEVTFGVDENAAIVLDAYDNILWVDDSSIASGNYLYIDGVAASSALSTTLLANAYFTDGTKSEITIEKVRDASRTDITKTVTTAASSKINTYDGWYSYSVSDDNKYTLTAASTNALVEYKTAQATAVKVVNSGKVSFLSTADANATDNTATAASSKAMVAAGSTGIRGNANTIFVVKNEDGDLKVYTGITSLPDITTSATNDDKLTVTYIKTGDNGSNTYASLVYIDAEDASNIDDANNAYDVMYILDQDTRFTNKNDTIVRWNAVVNGEQTKVEAKAGELSEHTMYYKVKSDSNSYLTATNYPTIAAPDGAYKRGTLAGGVSADGYSLVIGSGEYIWNDDTQITLIVRAPEMQKDDTADTGYEVTEGISARSLDNILDDWTVSGSYYAVTTTSSGDTLKTLYVVVDSVDGGVPVTLPNIAGGSWIRDLQDGVYTPGSNLAADMKGDGDDNVMFKFTIQTAGKHYQLVIKGTGADATETFYTSGNAANTPGWTDWSSASAGSAPYYYIYKWGVDASVGNDSPNGEWDSTNSALVAGTTYSYTIQQADDSSGNNATTILTGTFVA